VLVTGLSLLALTGIGLAVRLLVLRVSGELNSDEVLPGLMALHIAQGRELPVFFYGQHYFGALEAYLLAGLFRIAGFWPWLLVVPPIAASLALIPLSYALGRHLAGAAGGLLACLPVAIPPPILAKLFTNSGGGFSLAFALHAASLVCCLQASVAAPNGRAAAWLATYSLLMGLLCWVWQPALLLFPVLWLFVALVQELWRRPLRLLASTLPVLLGLVPPLFYNVSRGWPTVAQLGAKYVAPANEAASGDWSGPRAVLVFLFTAFGGGNEAEGGANSLLALLVCAAFPLAVLLLSRDAGLRNAPVKQEMGYSGGARRRSAGALLLAASVNVVSAHNTVRHLMPVALIGYVFLGAALALLPAVVRAGLPRVAVATAAAATMLAAVIAPNIWLIGQADSIFRRFTASTAEVRQIVAALDERRLITGYADYWTAYPIVYFSGERIVLAPVLPVVWGGRFDRYPPYTHTLNRVDDVRRLFVLVDDRCPLLPITLTLDFQDASYRAEHIARWYLIWDVQPAAGASDLLSSWRQVLSARDYC
jgi:hypothetical protein